MRQSNDVKNKRSKDVKESERRKEKNTPRSLKKELRCGTNEKDLENVVGSSEGAHDGSIFDRPDEQLAAEGARS